MDQSWRLSTAQQRYPPILSNNDSGVQIELVQLLEPESDSMRPDGLWVVKTNTVGLPSTLIAKFSDPVYHFKHSIGRLKDAFYFANESISNESWAYPLMEELQGKSVPRYHGHYLANLPSPQLRTVSVLLIELINGVDLKRFMNTDRARNEICDRHNKAFAEEAFRINWSIRQCGVINTDLASRNLMLRAPRLSSGPCKDSERCPFHDGEEFLEKLVMIDFEVVVRDIPKVGYERYKEINFENRYMGLLSR